MRLRKVYPEEFCDGYEKCLEHIEGYIGDFIKSSKNMFSVDQYYALKLLESKIKNVNNRFKRETGERHSMKVKISNSVNADSRTAVDKSKKALLGDT